MNLVRRPFCRAAILLELSSHHGDRANSRLTIRAIHRALARCLHRRLPLTISNRSHSLSTPAQMHATSKLRPCPDRSRRSRSACGRLASLSSAWCATAGCACCFRKPKILTSRRQATQAPDGDQAGPSSLDHFAASERRKTRLEDDLAQSHAPTEPAPSRTQERAAMRQVLAAPDFRDLQQHPFATPSLKNSATGSTVSLKAQQISKRAPPGLAARWCGDSFSRFALRWFGRCCDLSGAGAFSSRPTSTGPHPAQPRRATGNSGLKMRAAPPHQACGARPFTLSTGRRSRALIAPPVAGRPRPHPARIPRPCCPRRSAQARPLATDRHL